MKPNFPAHLFWDTGLDKIDFEKHSSFVIVRVLMRGNLGDFREIKRYYGMERMKEAAINARYLDKLTLNFCSLIFDTPKEKFRCYNTEPSIRQLWDY
jgi:hypothetical protein